MSCTLRVYIVSRSVSYTLSVLSEVSALLAHKTWSTVVFAEALVLGSAAAPAGVPAGGRRRARALLREAENEVLAEADEADLRLEQAVIDIEGPVWG